MPLIDYNEAPEKKPQPVPSVIEAPDFNSILIDTEYVPRRSILTQIEGGPWKVILYSQVLGKDSALNGHNPGKDDLNQAFIETKDFILRVTSPLTTSQDTTSNSMNVVGSANTYPGIKINQGDMFVANVGDGRAGIFRVTNVEEKSYFKDTTAAIDYVLVSWADNGKGKERYQDLISKVIRTDHFVYEFMEYNQDPYLISDDYNKYLTLKDAKQEILDLHLRLFVNKELKALVVPGQKPMKTYDHFFTLFMHRCFDINDSLFMTRFKVFNVSDDPWMDAYTIWNVLTEREEELMRYATQLYALAPTEKFTKDGMLEGVYYSGFDDVIYPLNPPLGGDFCPCCCPKIEVSGTSLVPSCDMRVINNYNGTPLIYPACKDGYYVFSRHFYEEDKQMSLMEAQTWKYIKKEPLDIDIILALVKEYHQWGSLEKFYYLPVILLFINSTIRGM